MSPLLFAGLSRGSSHPLHSSGKSTLAFARVYLLLHLDPPASTSQDRVLEGDREQVPIHGSKELGFCDGLKEEMMEEEYAGMEIEENEEEEITQEDAWAVITAYFEEKGLVRQQLDSFDEVIQNTMQEIVDESADIEISPESQHNPGRQSEFSETLHKISFGQIYLSRPMMTESDGETATLFPKAAGLRNLTYSAPLL